MAFPDKMRGGGRVGADPCGCTYQDQRWLSMCQTHLAEAQAIHTTAMAQYRETQIAIQAGRDARAAA